MGPNANRGEDGQKLGKADRDAGVRAGKMFDRSHSPGSSPAGGRRRDRRREASSRALLGHGGTDEGGDFGFCRAREESPARNYFGECLVGDLRDRPSCVGRCVGF